LNPADAKFLANVERYGWAVTKVFIPPGEEANDFARSTGLFLAFGHPEIVMFGLPLDRMQTIINIIGNRIKSDEKFVPGQDYFDVFERHLCKFEIVNKSHYKGHFGRSNWFYEGHDYPALQCIWPDRDGFFPYQRECNVGIQKLQNPLYLPIPNKNERV